MSQNSKYLIQAMNQRIKDKLKKLNFLRPLPKNAVKKLREQFEVEMTYNSNAIEGNSLTLKETFLVLSEGITIKGKPLKDHLEAKDHQEALEYLFDLVEKDKKNTLSSKTIRSLHQLITQTTDKEFSGQYRTGQVYISGSDHQPPEAIEVPKLMDNLVRWINSNYKKINAIELAAIAHHKLVNIHPFFDGNGRTARLLMNLLLMQNSYPLVIILKNDRKKYYQVLATADKGDCQPLIKFIAQAVERSLDIYLKALIPQKNKDEKLQLLSEIAPHTPYSTKYLNLLARQGKLEAHKKGRNWLTSIKAVNNYINQRQRKR